MSVRTLLQTAGVALFGALAFMGCDDDAVDKCDEEGLGRCVDTFPPDEIERATDDKSGDMVQTLRWKPGEYGPRCLGGEAYHSYIREGTSDSNDVLIYMPSDGARLVHGGFMLTSGGAPPVSYDKRAKSIFNDNSPFSFLQDITALTISPCDGSLYLGDRDYSTEDLEEALDGLTPSRKDLAPRYYRGFINAAASVNELARQHEDPERVFLVGSMAGGFGVVGMAAHAAEVYPNADIFVLQDGSPAMGMGDVDPSFFEEQVRLWGAGALIPPDAGEYGTSGHVMTLMNYVMEQYPNVRVATFASIRENSIRLIINGHPHSNGGITEDEYRCFVTSTLAQVKEKAPEGRYNYYVVDRSADNIGELRDDGNDKENFVLTPHDSDPETPISIKEWLTLFADKSEDWTSHSEVQMTPETADNCAGITYDD